MSMHIHKLMAPPVYMHIYPYTGTCSYIQPAVSAPPPPAVSAHVHLMYQHTTGCISPVMQA